MSLFKLFTGVESLDICTPERRTNDDQIFPHRSNRQEATLQTIDIDFDVFKALTVLRASAADTYNDVLRELLKLPLVEKPSSAVEPTKGMGWVSKGVTFPDGTEFRATYKGQHVTARVARGRLRGAGDKIATSLSQAARLVTQNSVDGWSFWEVKRPSDLHWQQAGTLRQKP